jgi:hypothetical protein
MLGDRITRMLIIGSIVFVMIACVLPTKDRFVMTVGGQKRVITRQDDPTIYWGTEAGVLAIAVALFSFGIYRSRKK